MFTRAAVLTGLLAVAAAAGCKSTTGTAAKEENCIPAGSVAAATAPADKTGKVLVVNQVCPVMNQDGIPGRWADEDSVVEWRGKKVGMCCSHCLPKWNKMSDAEKDAALKKAM